MPNSRFRREINVIPAAERKAAKLHVYRLFYLTAGDLLVKGIIWIDPAPTLEAAEKAYRIGATWAWVILALIPLGRAILRELLNGNGKNVGALFVVLGL